MAEVSDVKRTERGWAGHLCVADRCRFHRNTLLEGGGRGIVVSTVGAYFPPGREKIDTIGAGRHYETMAFRADMRDAYRDALVSCQVFFSSTWALMMTTDNEDTIDNLADQMHEAVVAEIAADFDAKWESGKSLHEDADGD